MKLTRGERERLRGMFNLFLTAQRRCSETTEIGKVKKAVYSSIVVTIGFVLGDDGMFEQNMMKWIDEVKSFGVIDEKKWSPDNN